MSPKDEWEKVIIPQFDKATQDKLKAWRKRSLTYSWLGSILMALGAFMIGHGLGGFLH